MWAALQAAAKAPEAALRSARCIRVTTMNYLVTGSTNDLIIPANVIDTLVEYDAYGAIKPALAESWETSEDGLTWTFHLREGVKWYDYTGKEVAPVTAQDFVDAAIYALDAKNASSTEYMMEGIIANATEYYKPFGAHPERYFSDGLIKNMDIW